MGTVHLIDRSFDPEAIHALGAAFDSAWQDLEASGNIFNSHFTPDWARKRIATRIITRVLGGERDPSHLSDDALADLAHALQPHRGRLPRLAASLPAGSAPHWAADCV
jgi:hypothetical protein